MHARPVSRHASLTGSFRCKAACGLRLAAVLELRDTARKRSGDRVAEPARLSQPASYDADIVQLEIIAPGFQLSDAQRTF